MKALAEQQLRWAQRPNLQAFEAQQGAWAHVLQAPGFRQSFLREANAFKEAFQRLDIPEVTSAFDRLQQNPDVVRWATALGKAVEGADSQADVEYVEVSTHDVLASEDVGDSVREIVDEASLTPFESIGTVAVQALEEGISYVAASQEAPEEFLPTDHDVATYRRFLQIWGPGHVVVACRVLAIISGQFLVALGVLAALAQISGYNLKDFIEAVKKSRDKD